MSEDTHMNDTDFTYLYFLSFEYLNVFYSTRNVQEGTVVLLKGSTLKLGRMEKEMWKSGLMIFTGLLSGENSGFPACILYSPQVQNYSGLFFSL